MSSKEVWPNPQGQEGEPEHNELSREAHELYENYQNEKKEESNISREEWYLKAQKKAESFLQDIDPDLHVEVDYRKIISEGKEEPKRFVLSFTHKSKPDLKWMVGIREDDEYIENKLEGVVEKIYSERTSSWD